MSYGNTCRGDHLFLPQQQLLSFAAEMPTPFFLYHVQGIRKTAQLIQGSFCWNPGHRPYFPIKANCCPAVLAIVRQEGFGVLAQSEGELLLAVKCGFSGTELLLHTPALTDALQALTVRTGCGVIFDAPCQIERMASALPKRCLLRYSPSKDRNCVCFTNNTDKNKSGMSRAQVIEAAQRLTALGVTDIGLHCHLGSGAQKPGFYPAVAQELFSLAQDLREQTGISVSCCDLGGGLGLCEQSRKTLLSLPHIGALVRENYRAAFDGSFAPALYTELGRFVIGRHGLLLSRVIELRQRTRCYAVLDASASMLPRLQHGSLRLSVVGDCSRENRRVYSVQGCTADPHDRFSDRAILPPLKPGSLLALHGAGAYGEAMQLPLCMLPPCGSYLYTEQGDFVRTHSFL